MMKTNKVTVSLALIVMLAACSGNKNESAADTAHHHDTAHAVAATPAKANKPQFNVDTAFQQQLAAVFSAYVQLKEAFVSSDATQVGAEATKTTTALGAVDIGLLSGAAHNDWMAYLAPMQSSLESIQASSDIEAQRKAFSTLSDNLYKSVKAFGLGGAQAYYVFCPMAFDNEGGYWLSDQQQIRNPYFGSSMLTCGQVEETLR